MEPMNENDGCNVWNNGKEIRRQTNLWSKTPKKSRRAGETLTPRSQSFGLRPSVHTIHHKLYAICHFQYDLEQTWWIWCTLRRTWSLTRAYKMCRRSRGQLFYYSATWFSQHGMTQRAPVSQSAARVCADMWGGKQRSRAHMFGTVHWRPNENLLHFKWCH